MARATLCLDTDILIDFLRARGEQPTLFELAVERYTCVLPSVTVYEVSFGIERYGRANDRRMLQTLLRTMEVIPFDLRAARASAQLDAVLQRAGQRVDFPDLFIAGICVARKLPLLTRNRAHFSRIPHLILLDPHALLAAKGLPASSSSQQDR